MLKKEIEKTLNNAQKNRSQPVKYKLGAIN